MTSAGSAESLPSCTAAGWNCLRHGGIPPVRTGACSAIFQVVRDAWKRDLPSLLILEDDVVFDPSFSEKFPDFIRGLPADWDMVFLGALQREDPCSGRRECGSHSAGIFHIRLRVKELGLRCVHRGQRRISQPGLMSTATACFKQTTIVMASAPNLAWVESRYSPVQERMADHWYLRESIVPLGSQMDRILQRTVVILAHRAAKRECHERKECGVPVAAFMHRVPTRNQDLRC